MSTKQLVSLDELGSRFDEFSKRFLRDGSPEYVDVEVQFPNNTVLRAQREIPLLGLTYDRRSNTIEFMSDVGDHRVYRPREVHAIIQPDGFISSLEIVRDDGARETVEVVRYARRRIRAGV
jgi:hypothetical protein